MKNVFPDEDTAERVAVMDIGQWVHFSVDDVIACFQWVYGNGPGSVFDEPMLGKLKKWHENYHLCCDLYVFEKCNGFRLEQLQDRYWKELKKEAGWLKFAWHAPDAKTDMEKMDSDLRLEQEALVSLDHTYRLILEKVGERGWSDTVRLHLWTASEKVLLSLRQKKVNVLLATDRDRMNYHLDKECLGQLKELGSLWKEPYTYRLTDICFDCLEEEVSVRDLLDRTEECFKKYPGKPCLELFFHEWKFESVVSGIEAYMGRFETVRIPLLADAGVMVGKKIYFTAANSSELYEMDVEDQRVMPVAALPYEPYQMKHGALCHYRGTVWAIPLLGDNIFSICLNTGRVTVYPLDFINQGTPGKEKFLKDVIADGPYLWLLPWYDVECIVRIDMGSLSVRLYTGWPPELELKKGGAVNFSTMIRCGRKLYLIKREASHNIALDMDTGKMSLWKEYQLRDFGGFIGNDELVTVPMKESDSVKIHNTRTGMKKEFTLPGWVWTDYKDFPFWYSKQVENIYYIFPLSAKAMVAYDIESDEVRCVEMKAEGYSSLFLGPCIAVTDVFSFRQKRYFLPYLGNVMIRTDAKGDNMEALPLFLEAGKFGETRGYSYGWNIEDERRTLEGFLEQMTAWEVGRWNGIMDQNAPSNGPGWAGRTGASIFHKII